MEGRAQKTGALIMAITGLGMLLFGFGATLFTVNYLSLRQANTPDALLGRKTATMRFLTVAAAPVGSLFGGLLASAIGLRATLGGGAAGSIRTSRPPISETISAMAVAGTATRRRASRRSFMEPSR